MGEEACAPCWPAGATTLKPGGHGGAEQPVQTAARICPTFTLIAPPIRRDRHAALLPRQIAATTPTLAGSRPARTPPASRTLEEEGVVLDDVLLLDGGAFREAEFSEPSFLAARATRRAIRTRIFPTSRPRSPPTRRVMHEIAAVVFALWLADSCGPICAIVMDNAEEKRPPRHRLAKRWRV